MTLQMLCYMTRLCPWIKGVCFQGFSVPGGFSPYLESFCYSYYAGKVGGIISVFTPCASSWGTVHFMPHFVLENLENCLRCLVGLVSQNHWPCWELSNKVLSILSWVCFSYSSPVLAGRQLSLKWVAKTIFQLLSWMRKKQKSQFWLCLFGSFLAMLPGVRVWKTKDNVGPLLNGGGEALVREDTEKTKLPNTFLCISLPWQDQPSATSDPGLRLG